MQIEIGDFHIRNLAKINNYRITDLDQLKTFIAKTVFDEAQENGATHLCILIEKMLDLAYEDDQGICRIQES